VLFVRICDALYRLQAKLDVCVVPPLFFAPDSQIHLTPRLSLMRGGDLFFTNLKVCKLRCFGLNSDSLLTDLLPFLVKQTIGITVNLKGVMGAGNALDCKNRLPDAYVQYQASCRAVEALCGRVQNLSCFRFAQNLSHLCSQDALRRGNLRLGNPYLYDRRANLEQGARVCCVCGSSDCNV